MKKSARTKTRSRLERLEAAAAEAAAMKRGEKTGARTISPADLVKGLRARLGLSQAQFAARFGVPIGTLRDWENGRRRPEGAAVSLIRVIAYAPDIAAKAIAA
jgi:putative transcriptional regulator